MKRIALLSLLLASPVHAQSVTVPAEIRGAAGAWIIVAPTVDGGVPKWRVDPGLQEVDLAALLGPDLVSKLKGKVFTADTAGRYKVEIWCAKGNIASDIATVTLVIGGKPAPPEPPAPKPDKRATHITFIGPELTPASLATNNDAALRTWLKVNGLKVHVLKANDPGIETAGLEAAVEKAGGAPCVVLQDDTGSVVAVSSLTTAAALRTFVGTYVKGK